ncbi:DNA topoisomerase III [Mangrovitalea sediminis]|uniref:DNA topoisomerase III n=1 Tax=Mangrovitalea sediminis TaxID=1982043 RepID=UPI000BE51348|nr:DNA topoisomerase 3 [Mangrovitalea sediminis]
MRLYIAEKPSLGRAIAAALPGPQRRGNGLIRCGDEAVVSWCVGHLLEPAEPGHYEPRWLRWRMEDLPIFPRQWEVTPKPKTEPQLRILGQLLREASEVVHAGDPDREGQLLVDEVLRFFKVTCPVRRVFINDLNGEAVTKALANLHDNREYRRLSYSALARQRADWLYGMNLSRACTLRYRQDGERGVYSVGRVQTPVLGLVVQRDDQIRDFQPKPFFIPEAEIHPFEQSDQSFKARWIPDERYQAALDEDNRLLEREVAEQICNDVRGQSGTVVESRFRDRQEAPALPLSLSVLQIEAARHFHLSAQQTLDAAQNLYEKHRLITYPRSDCRYLPEGHFAQRLGVLQAIRHNLPSLMPAVDGADPDRRSDAWNDRKVDAHHAIIPSLRQLPAAKLSTAEQQVYELVCRFYLMQFYPPAIHREGKLVCRFGQHRFRATETGIVDAGWKKLELRSRAAPEQEKPPLPRLMEESRVQCRDTTILERTTQPPLPFTDATLLSAMTGIARFVKDTDLRKTLRETDGLGTEATRAAIIETLFRREYLIKEGRYIHATEKGQSLIHRLPDTVVRPDMTAVWESTLETIRFGSGDPREFIARLQQQIINLLGSLGVDFNTAAPAQKASARSPHCPQCRAPMRQREGRYGPFWACTRFPECRVTRPIDQAGEATTDGTSEPPIPCPKCHAPLKRLQGKRGWFWGCSNYPSCRLTLSDLNGRPDVTPLK